MSVLMLGPSFEGQGGVAAVANVFKQSGLFEKYGITYLATTLDGSSAQKFCQLVKTWTSYIRMLFHRNTRFVHIHLASRNSTWRKLLFIIPAVMLRKNYIIHLHGGEYQKFFEDECGAFGKAIVRGIFDRANSIIVLSSRWKEIVSSFSRNLRIFVINNPVIIGNKPLHAIRPEFNFVFLGRLGQGKGIFDLIEAFKITTLKCPQVRLLCGGDGEIEAVLAAVDKAGLKNNFKFIGWVSGKAKDELMRRTDVFVLPSYNEGLPMSILEALAYGIPVISTLVGGIPDAIEEGKEGFLVEPGNVTALAKRMLELAINENLRQQMSDRAYARAVEMFSSERIIPRIEAIYDEL